MRRPRRPAQDLRLAVECLPTETKRAMLEGIRSNTIIVGAYTDRGGGVCPMLAAHRAGGRTSFSSFANAWDRYTGAKSRARRATERELRTLVVMLESAIASDDQEVDLTEVAAELRDSQTNGNGRAAPRPGDRNRTRELRDRPGWAWMRLFRRYDEYEAALERIDTAGEPDRAERELERV